VRAVVQRVRRAHVEVEGQTVGAIDVGLVAFIGAQTGDTPGDYEYIAAKITSLRVFEDERGKMARALADVDGGLLVVSQFTLFGDVRRGNRPSFTEAMAPDAARAMLEQLVELCRSRVTKVEQGRFGADMRVVVDNDGPVTILLDSRTR
jgi:D-tyrosyl-tRNA(Tyr) deacylase